MAFAAEATLVGISNLSIPLRFDEKNFGGK